MDICVQQLLWHFVCITVLKSIYFLFLIRQLLINSNELLINSKELMNDR